MELNQVLLSTLGRQNLNKIALLIAKNNVFRHRNTHFGENNAIFVIYNYRNENLK